MTLHLHRAERSDRLVAALGELLSDPLEDPFAAEIVCVPTRGVERWLSQELSGRLGTAPDRDDGVCAGVEFPSPRRLVAGVVAAALGEEVGDAARLDPWQPGQAVWPLLQVIDASRGEPFARLLWASFSSSGSSARRWSTARHLADLFARYASTRPAMIASWRGGLDVDATGHPLPPDRAWQAELWRRLREVIGTPDPAERTGAALKALHNGTRQLDLPGRLSVFGATRLEPDHLAVLAAVAERHDLHLWLPHPSPVSWSRLAAADPVVRRGDDRSEALVEHRLLAYLSRDARELQRALTASATGAVEHHYPSVPGGSPDHTLLGRLQADITVDQPVLRADRRPVLDPSDRSVQLHASHGQDRQVEVLREVLVGLLADDPTLEPRDVIVMCPDIETYAPLIAAAFGLDDGRSEAEHPGHRLRVRLADRSLRQLNPLLAVLATVVGLADSRMTATALLDLCATAPVARRFGFRPDDLERLRELVLDAGVRWGLDAAHRDRFGMGAFGQNTWAAGLDRLLLGVTMDETDQHFLGTALPMDDVDSADVDLVGRLAECVRRVETITDACRVRQGVGAWVGLFKEALDLLTAVPAADGWQLGHAYAELSRITEEAALPPTDSAAYEETQLGLAEVSAVLAEAFRGRPTRANFRTGTLTMCTMMPMRSVPHRVVCLLGVDDGVFPRPTRLDGDDITAVEEWIGDRSERSEDRQLLLDAIMSAEERLLVIYAGADPRSGKPTPPAVPIRELIESLDQTMTTADGTPVRDAITVRHPLQPFDPRNFAPGALADRDRPFSFDRSALRGVRAGQGGRVEPGQRPPALPPLPETWLPTVADLTRFFGHPIRALLKDRSGLSSWRDDDDLDEQLPVELNGLDRWQIGDRLLQQRLLGRPLGSLADAEWRRGTLPPRAFGQQTLDRLLPTVSDLAETARPFLTEATTRTEVLVDLGSAGRLTGVVANIHGSDIVRVSFSKLSAKSRLQAWIELLSLTAARPDQEWRAVTIGSNGTSILGPVPGPWATKVVADLVELQRTGLVDPLPLAPRTSAEYARLRRLDRPLEPYLKELEKTWAQERDDTYEQFFGTGVTLADLFAAQPSRPEEERGSLVEPSRFGTLARRVFHPMLLSEELR